MAYLLDANVFIQAKNLHYGFDFCPAFWDWLIRQNQAGEVFSIEKVGRGRRVGRMVPRQEQWLLPPSGCRHVPCTGTSQYLDFWAELRAEGNKHFFPSGGLLSRCTGLDIRCVTPYEMLRN